MNPIPVLLVCYNRLEYTKQALRSVYEEPGMPIDLVIWDNASTDGTVQWLKQQDWMNIPSTELAKVDIVYNAENRGLAYAMNWFFRKFKDEPYVVKVDNDTVLPKNWLSDLVKAMESQQAVSGKIGAVSPTCVRPPGRQTFDEWVRESMITVPFDGHHLHYNSYVLGTGVLINMEMIRDLGLLFELFPYGPEPGETRTCLISGWTAYTRIAADYHGWRFAFYSKVHANLLNLKAERVLSDDYPEYDAELKDARDQGNAWWESVGGLPGVRKYVQDHGGLEPLMPKQDEQRTDEDPSITRKKNYLTPCVDQHYERSTLKFWQERVQSRGEFGAIFLDQPAARTQEFARIHDEIIRKELAGKDVCEVGVGWGRVSRVIGKVAKSYVGTDFVERLVLKAKEALPQLEFHVADARDLPFQNHSFDAVVAVTCLSSFEEPFGEVVKELMRVLRPDGFILLLEEEESIKIERKRWKLEN